MPSQRDYMIATVLGEDNLGIPEGQAAIIDSIFNRQNAILSGKRTPGYFEAKSSSIQDIVTANRGNQYNTWKGTPEEAGNAARAARALQGREATSGREREQYDQIAKIYDDYMAGEGGWQGISQGATFYQTPKSAADGSFQNKYYTLNGGNNYQDIGSHRFSGEEGQYFKDKNAFYQANPQLYNPNVGAGYDPSSPLNPGVNTQGPGDFFGVGPGDASNFGRPYETGGTSYDFSGSDVSSGVGPGFNNLGGATPFGDVSRFAFGSGLNVGGGIGNGTFGAFGNPFSYNAPSGGPGDAFGAGNGMAGQLPPGFDSAAYLAQNGDVAASGMDAATHWRNFGAAEGRALAPPGWTQTQGPPSLTPTGGTGTVAPKLGAGSTASTIGAPVASGGLPPFFSPVDYVNANPDLVAAGITPATAAQHFLDYGQFETRALAPWLEAKVYAAPAGTPTLGPTTTAPTLLPDGGVSVASTGLVPTQGPPDLTSTIGPGPTITARTGTFNGDQYLQANGDVAAAGLDPLQHFLNYGYKEGRAIDTLGTHFNGQAYLAQNGDVAMAGLDPLAHFLRYGAQEARTLAPTNWATPLTATTEVTPQGSSWLASTYGPGTVASTIGAPTLTPTLDTATLAPTIQPPALTGTYGAPSLTPTLGPSFTQPSWSPGGGINNQFGFSGANVGTGLGATSKTFGSYYPLDTSIGASSGGSPGGGGIADFGFSGADVSGFDLNAASPPMEGGGQGGGGGGGGTAKGSSSSAAFLQDQARTRAYWDSLVKPADLYGNTNTHTTPVITPVVPNLTTSNLALGAPGAMFSMFAPWQ